MLTTFRLFLLLSGLVFFSNVNSQVLVKGRILEKDSKKPVPFASIIPKNYNQFGAISDIDGNFKLYLPKEASYIQVNHVLFRELVITKQELLKNNNIFLESSNFEIKEVLVHAKENPAFRIIRNAAKNKKKNSPEKYKYYECDIYQKTFMGPVLDDTTTIDSSLQTIKNLSDSLYFFLMETHSKKYHEFGKGNKEIVKAIEVAGLKRPEMFMSNNEVQPFHFYDEYINLYDNLFLSPISDAAIGKYYYEIIDTIISTTDTVFSIFYRPYKNKAFNGLTGQIQINTNGYAIQNIYAKPAGHHLAKINVHQQYVFVNNKWFPEEINYDLVFENHKLNSLKIKISGRSRMSNVSFIPPEIKEVKVDHIAYEFLPDAFSRDSSYWLELRHIPQTFKEQNSFVVLDSLFEKENIEKWMIWGFRIAESGKIPLKYLSIDPVQTIGYNHHEGFRAGIGLYTNQDLLKWLVVGGYYREGLKDKVPKYGAEISFIPNRAKRFKFGGGFAYDIDEPGYNNFDQLVPSVFSRSLLLQYADSSVSYYGFIQRQFGKWFLKLDGKTQSLTPKYNYQYRPDSNKLTLHNNQIRLSVQYAPKERVNMIYGFPFSIQGEPVFRMQYIRGFKDNLGRGYNYNKFLFSAEHYYKIAGLGESNIHLKAGYVSPNVPLFALIEGEGSYDANIAFVFDGYFQNIAPSTFFNNAFAGLFFQHNFGPVVKITPKLKPELALAHHMGWGSLQNKYQHKNFEFQTMKRGYFESGIIINNVLMMNMVNAFYLGIGGGAFYKYGAYASTKQANNFAYKISLSIRY